MKLIIAEKNSVAQNIAHAVGAYQKISADAGNAYCYANDEYYVAFARGHLYNLADPDVYGYSKNFKKSYESGELPMIPKEFAVVPLHDSYTDDLRKFLTEIIKKDTVTEIINACDAAREGELIFREIYNASGSNKPVKRLWVSSVTEQAINDGLSNLKPSTEYDNLYRTARTRAELDWLFGMNLSRLYTALDVGYTHSVGRIVTPVLGIIVDRDNEIENFVSRTTYKLMLNNGAISTIEYDSKEEAEHKLAESNGKTVSVETANKETKSENRPKLYNLTHLQMDANEKYGYTADETLTVAQTLYEHKYITYPRTSGEYLTEDMRDTITKTAALIGKTPAYADRVDLLTTSGLNIDKRVINDKEIADHHAIIPTLQDNINISSLSEKEKNIYSLIVNRFLTVLDKPYTYNETKYEFWCEDVTYFLKCIEPIELGWKRYNAEEEDTSDCISYTTGETFDAVIEIKECITQPLKHFTDKSLLSVMENIDNRIDDNELKAAVKGKGIGTDATRAAIITKLITTHYVERKGKQLIATEFGRQFVSSLPRQILSVERTAEWEQLFEDIERNGTDDTSLYDETIQLVSAIIKYESTNTERKPLVNPNPDTKFETVVVGICPRCGKDIVEKNGFYGCSSYVSKENKGCGFSFSKTHSQGWFKGSISVAQAKKLLKNEVIKLKAVSQSGKEYDADWKLSDDGTYVNIVKIKAEEKELKSVGTCPRCGKDIVEKNHAFCCSSWTSPTEPGCGFSIFKNDKKWNVSITAKNASELLAKGTTKIKTTTLSGTQYTEFKLEEKEVNGKKYVNLVPVNKGVEYGK